MTKAIKTIIIDDEIAFINTLQILLKSKEEFQIIGYARSVKEGLELIEKTAPDLVFLDVELGDQTGFDLLAQINHAPLNVVFITAYDQYAIEAFRFSAVDYLLKPVVSGELFKTLEKVKEQISNKLLQLKINTLVGNMKFSKKKKILLKDFDSHHIVEIDQILWCAAEGSYTKFYLEHNKTIIVSKHLKAFESLLSPYQFCRIHRSHLVNVNKIVRFDKNEGAVVFLESGDQLPVSFRKKEVLSGILEKM